MKITYKKIIFNIILILIFLQYSNRTYATQLITGHVTWSSPVNITEDIMIISGGILEITSIVYFSSNVSIIVQPQGKLIVDGGRLTNLDANQLWQGILLLGNPSSSQSLIQSDQGIVILENAILENAECAIKIGETIKETMLNGDLIYTLVPGGGIVSAENSQFLNNRKSIHFDEYIYRNGENEYDNKSVFTECSFMVDVNAFFEIQNYESQVSLFGVRGISFNGCVFSNTKSNHTGIGIYANTAGFKINNYIFPFDPYIVNPPYYPTQTQFSGYRVAIDVKSSGSKSVNIINANFSNNKACIYATLVNNLRLESSIFNIPSNAFCGIQLQNSTNYFFENNIFEGNAHGVIIKGDVPDNNYIRYNTFHNQLCNACCIYGNQQKHEMNGYLSTGLQFQCNFFENNYTDINIMTINSTDISRIKYQQKGISGHACGNVFMLNTSTLNINNMGDQIVAYFGEFHNPNYNEVPYAVNGPYLYHYVPPCDCPFFGYTGNAYYNNRIIGQINELEDRYSELKPRLDVLISEYENNYNDTIHWTDFYNGDNSYKQQINDYDEIVTLKDSIDMTCSEAIQILLSVDVLDKQSFKTWVSRIESANMDFLLAECYLDENDSIMMNDILNNIPIKFQNYSLSDIEEYAKCLKYVYIWNLNYLDSTYINQLDLDTLNTIASGTGIASDLAKSILERIGYDIEIYDMSQICLWPISENTPNNISKKSMNRLDMKIIPNPTYDEITIKFENKEDVIHYLLIFDVYGKQILSQEVNTSVANVNLSDYSSGIYLIRCVMNDGTTIIKKVIKK